MYHIVGTITVLVIVCAVLYKLKPSWMFNQDGSMKSFGTGPDQTIFHFGIITGVAAIMAYFVFSYMRLVERRAALRKVSFNPEPVYSPEGPLLPTGTTA